MPNFYKVKGCLLGGTSYKEVSKNAYRVFEKVVKKSKRRTYIRSKYFKNQKVFISIFWGHLKQKRRRERMKRLKLHACALELIKNTTIKPEAIFENKGKYFLYRFYGKSNEGIKFIVQVKETRKGGKYFISVFPTSK